MKGYHHLGRDERVGIEVLCAEGLGVRGIAARLGRPPSTISRELRRGRNLDGTYRADSALKRARRQCRGRPPRLIIPPCLDYPRGNDEWQALMAGFEYGWSPEIIAGRYHLQPPASSLCHETVYRFIYASNLY